MTVVKEYGTTASTPPHRHGAPPRRAPPITPCQQYRRSWGHDPGQLQRADRPCSARRRSVDAGAHGHRQRGRRPGEALHRDGSTALTPPFTPRPPPPTPTPIPHPSSAPPPPP